MTFSELVLEWAVANAERLDRLGKKTVQSSGLGGPKPAAHIAIESDAGFAEIIVWDSGEAEFAYGQPGRATDEHHELTGPEELGDLLEQLVIRARA
jgi:hypothetical protein